MRIYYQHDFMARSYEHLLWLDFETGDSHARYSTIAKMMMVWAQENIHSSNFSVCSQGINCLYHVAFRHKDDAFRAKLALDVNVEI